MTKCPVVERIQRAEALIHMVDYGAVLALASAREELANSQFKMGKGVVQKCTATKPWENETKTMDLVMLHPTADYFMLIDLVECMGAEHVRSATPLEVIAFALDPRANHRHFPTVVQCDSEVALCVNRIEKETCIELVRADRPWRLYEHCQFACVALVESAIAVVAERGAA